jgi:hypothetical protein
VNVRLTALMMALAAVFHGTEASAVTTYYVATTGNNANAGTTTGAPWRTITYGVGRLVAGDTLLVRTGTYNESIGAGLAPGTSWSNKVRVAAYPGDTVWLRPTNATASSGAAIYMGVSGQKYIEFDGINLDGNLLDSGAVMWIDALFGKDVNHIRFQNAEIDGGHVASSAAIAVNGNFNEIINARIHGGGLPGLCGYLCASYGVYLAGHDNLVDRCDIYDTSGAGVQIFSNETIPGHEGMEPNNNIVKNTKIHDISRLGDPGEAWGIIISRGSNNQLYNNLIYNISVGGNSGDVGLAIAGIGTKVWYNTIYNVLQGGILIGDGITDVELRNNIAFNNGGSQYSNGGSRTTETNNLFGVDPGFVNAPAGDFHLQSTSVAAVNQGMTIATIASDIAGTVRPQGIKPDIGAYELVAISIPEPPTNVHIVP